MSQLQKPCFIMLYHQTFLRLNSCQKAPFYLSTQSTKIGLDFSHIENMLQKVMDIQDAKVQIWYLVFLWNRYHDRMKKWFQLHYRCHKIKKVIIGCNFWTVCLTDLCLTCLEMAENFPKNCGDVSPVYHLFRRACFIGSLALPSKRARLISI